jgi:hypothetical protein
MAVSRGLHLAGEDALAEALGEAGDDGVPLVVDGRGLRLDHLVS